MRAYVERMDTGRDIFALYREPRADYPLFGEQQMRANVVPALGLVDYFVSPQRQRLSTIVREIQTYRLRGLQI